MKQPKRTTLGKELVTIEEQPKGTSTRRMCCCLLPYFSRIKSRLSHVDQQSSRIGRKISHVDCIVRTQDSYVSFKRPGYVEVRPKKSRFFLAY